MPMKTVKSDHLHAAPNQAFLEALAEERLRAASIRATAARVRVLSVLLGAPAACSHQDVQDRLADMDRVTLYRALDCLTDAGVAHKIPGDDRVFRYSVGTEQGSADAPPSHAHHPHGHFKCTRCLRVFCLDSGDSRLLQDALTDATQSPVPLRRQLQDTLQQTLGEGFRSHDIELTIKGWCADCNH